MFTHPDGPCPLSHWPRLGNVSLSWTITHRDPLAGRQISAHGLRQSDPNPQLPADRGGWGIDWEPGAFLQGLCTDLCPSWGHAPEQSSTQCKALSSVFTMSVWSHPLRRVHISTLPQPSPWAHAIPSPGLCSMPWPSPGQRFQGSS